MKPQHIGIDAQPFRFWPTADLGTCSDVSPDAKASDTGEKDNFHIG